MPNQPADRLAARESRASIAWRERRRPWRVIPLALFAVVATTAAMGAAAHVFWQASGHRYADDILRQQLHEIDSTLAEASTSERPG